MSAKRFSLVACVLLAAVVGASLVVAMLAAPGPPQVPSFVLVSNGVDWNHEAVVLGAQAAARERGVKLAIERLGGAEASSRDVGEFVEKVDRENINGAIFHLQAGGQFPSQLWSLTEVTKVVTCGDDLWPERRLCHIGTGGYHAGRMCAEFLKQSLPSGGRIIVLVDDADQGEGAKRLAGLRDNLRLRNGTMNHGGSSEQFEIFECLEDFKDSDVCAQNMLSCMTRWPDAKCVVDLGLRSDRSSIDPLVALARESGVKFVTFNHSEASLAAVETGDVLAVIGDDPFTQGYLAVDRLATIFRGGALGSPEMGRGSVKAPAWVVRRENLAELHDYCAHRARLRALMRPRG